MAIIKRSWFVKWHLPRQSLANILPLFLLAVVIFGPLFTSSSASGTMRFIASEFQSIYSDPSTQWIAVSGCVFYFFILFFNAYRIRSVRSFSLSDPNSWLCFCILLILLSYFSAYRTASQSTHVLVFLCGIVLGKAVSMVIEMQMRECSKKTPETREQYQFPLYKIIVIFVVSLAVLSLWQPRNTVLFQYHSIPRWCGFWGNPNTFGLLMGTGMVLAVGAWAYAYKQKWNTGRYSFLFLFVVILLGVGLFKSYSRGAWMGTAFGLVYLTVQLSKSLPSFTWVVRNWIVLTILVISCLLLAYWQFRFCQSPPVQRLFSIVNIDDFSWRNRVAAWEGSVRMIRDKPVVGFGWVEAETAYQNQYSKDLNAAPAIRRNDFFSLAVSAGLPVLICFVAYVTLRFRASRGVCRSLVSETCKAGSCVLLTGFWFDGGLFLFSIGPIFWILIELSKPGVSETLQMKSPVASEKNHSLMLSDKWLKYVAIIAAVTALLQTTIYLSVPLFQVGDSNLVFARRFLVAPQEVADFDFLSKGMDWQGKELRVLLQHVKLANYNRQLVDWAWDDQTYREYILTATIQPSTDGNTNWRRTLWEYFYPSIRNMTSRTAAAENVIRRLREKIKLVPKGPQTIEEMWQQSSTDAAGFNSLSVAAFRSIGIAARLNEKEQAEFFDGREWHPIAQLQR